MRKTTAEGLLLAGAALVLSGCAAAGAPGSAAGDDAERDAQTRVAELARDIGDTRPTDMDGWARAAAANESGIELIAVDAVQSSDPNAPFGTLDLRVNIPADQVRDTDARDACFRVAFDYYGKVGEWSTSEGVDPIDCPPGAAVVTPPPDETVREVAAVNAREAARAVLSELPADPTAEDVTAAIAARLEPPTEQFRIAAPPRVVVESDGADVRVGVSMGSADDCVLVKSEGGVVTDVYPPNILLQPGELGCGPTTALAPDDLLRPPH